MLVGLWSGWIIDFHDRLRRFAVVGCSDRSLLLLKDMSSVNMSAFRSLDKLSDELSWGNVCLLRSSEVGRRYDKVLLLRNFFCSDVRRLLYLLEFLDCLQLSCV
jgi:hypothetical protein